MTSLRFSLPWNMVSNTLVQPFSKTTFFIAPFQLKVSIPRSVPISVNVAGMVSSSIAVPMKARSPIFFTCPKSSVVIGQQLNASSNTSFTVAGSTRLVMPVQPKAPPPIFFTFFRSILSNFLQYLKQLSGISSKLSGMVTLVISSQLRKASIPKVFNDDGSVMLFKPLFRKAQPSMVFTDDGRVIFFRPIQNANAASPIVLTDLGIVIFFIPQRPQNAQLPIFVTPVGITVVSQPTIRVLVAFSIIALQLLRES